MNSYFALANHFFLNVIFKQNHFLTEKKYIKQILPANPVIIEAGAHTGADTVKMSHAWKNATIYAFEPVPDIYKKLCNRTRFFKNINTYPFALSNKTGESEIFISAGTSDGSSSLLQPKEHLSEHPLVT